MTLRSGAGLIAITAGLIVPPAIALWTLLGIERLSGEPALNVLRVGAALTLGSVAVGYGALMAALGRPQHIKSKTGSPL
jgi:hypothetical protein